MAAQWQKRDVSRPKSATERAVAAIAGHQRQLLRIEQLEEIGLTRRGVAHRAASARLHRIHAGVYATHPQPYSRHQLYLAATYACGPGSLISGLCSAAIFGMTDHFPLIAEVTNQTGRGRSRHGITVHRRRIDPRDASSRHGIPTTSPARTIIDCAHRAGPEGTEDLIMAADAAQILNRHRLEELTQEHRSRPGVAHILSLITDDPVVTRSRNERRLFSICREFEVPLLLVNYRIDVPGHHFYADFLWPELRLIVEADSWRWHGGRQASESDADRDQLLAMAGYAVVHFTRDQILRRRAESGRRLQVLTAPI